MYLYIVVLFGLDIIIFMTIHLILIPQNIICNITRDI